MTKPLICPFTIAIDCQEKQPFSFTGLAGRQGRTLQVPTVWKSLGTSHGDYSIEGLEFGVGIERKSMEDAHGTFLGWGERRARFERELEMLSTFSCSAIVVECTLSDLIENAPSFGVKSAAENAKTLFRTVLAWQFDFRVPWLFCKDRRMAEIATFRVLERHWRKRKDAERKESRIERELAEL